MFTASKLKTTGDMAEDMGYNCGWLGLENSNPFPVGSIQYKTFEWGYNSALDDATEFAGASYPSNEYASEAWLDI